MRKYEIMYIVKPLDEEGTNAVITKFENLINNNGGQVEKIDRWGKKRLAYLVNDFAEGFYCLVNFSAVPATILELDRIMKITEDVLKFMIVRIDE